MTYPLPHPPAPPTPQQERAQRTRAAVLEAAAACLGARGLAGASTAAIATRASVSQGAVFRYFPTKDALLAEAVALVLAQLARRFATEIASRLQHTGREPIDAGIALLWDVFTDAQLYGVFEVFLAARTDDALRERLTPIIEAHAAAELAIARLLFPEAAATNERFDAVVLSVLTTLQGAAVAHAALPTTPHGPVELSFLANLVRSELGEPDLDALPAEALDG